MPRSERSRNIWMGLAAIGTVVVLFVVVRQPKGGPTNPRDLSTPAEVAKVVAPGLIDITAGSLLERKLDQQPVKTETVSFPLLTVTGAIAARIVPGAGKPEDRWQFSNPDLSNTFGDWQRANTEVEHATNQLAKTRELATAQVARFREVSARLERLVKAGTDAPKDLAAAKADLIQAQIQGQKDVFDAESALNLARRNRTAAERQLFQGGVDPSLLAATESTVVVVADVPEAKAASIAVGQECEVRFYALPDAVFSARVARIAPTVSVERRTLRVLFEINDSNDRLKPGMFADIGLGTEPRAALLIPTDAVLHVGNGDFVFARKQQGPWRVTKIQLGESRGTSIEVREGLAADDEVIGAGAILLKPFVVEALDSSAAAS